MSIANDILKRIDTSSGVDVNYRETTTWYDGTAISDAKCDGVIYRKKGTKYYKKSFNNFDTQYLIKNTIQDLRNITSVEVLMLKMNIYKGVQVQGYYAKGDTPAPIVYDLVEGSVDVDDGGSVIVVGTNRFIHVFDTVNVKYYGAKETGTDDDSAYINNALSNRYVQFLEFNKKTYLINSSINVNIGKGIKGNFAKIKTSTNITALSLKGNNIVRDLYLEGTGSTTLNQNNIAISGIGSSSSAYIDSIELTNIYINSFAYYGVLFEFCKNITIRNLYIDGVGYAGYMGFSNDNVLIDNGYVKNITGTGTLGYGIAFTRRATDSSLTVYPRSKNCIVSNFTVENNPTWEAYDTHAGDNINFVNCISKNCKVGVAIVPSQLGGVDDHAPINCTVSGCQVYGNGTGSGIIISGALASPSSNPPTDLAINCKVTSNTVINSGEAGNNISGAIKLQATEGVIVTGNKIKNSREVGINLYLHNNNFKVNGNIVLDNYSEVYTSAPCIALREKNNTGDITNNTTLRVDTSLGTYVSVQGVNLLTDTTNIVNLGLGYNTCTLASNESFGVNTKYATFGGGRFLTTNSASPEGVITAPRGSMCINTSGGAGSVFYFKEVGSGNTGWKSLLPDTASTTVKGIVNMAAASSNSATDVGASYSQTEVQAILTELRDLKTKLRTAGVLAP